MLSVWRCQQAKTHCRNGHNTDFITQKKEQMNYNSDENEMPYDILERFGLTLAMIDDLPTDVLQNIYNGCKSPVLPVHIVADDSEEVKARTRFCLVRTPEGGVDVLFYPQLDEFDLKLFNEQQEKNLIAGKPIVGHLESNEVGNELGSKCFFQLDPESKQVLSVPTSRKSCARCRISWSQICSISSTVALITKVLWIIS